MPVASVERRRIMAHAVRQRIEPGAGMPLQARCQLHTEGAAEPSFFCGF